MIRTLWRLFVPGYRLFIVYWLACAGDSIYREHYEFAALWAILAILNAYSYDYQRRRAAGEVVE